MESCGVLNPSSDLDIYCLHVTCFRILSKTVDEFRNGWNQHPLSTEGNKTPHQLFVNGLLALKKDRQYHEELCQVNKNYVSFSLVLRIKMILFLFYFCSRTKVESILLRGKRRFLATFHISGNVPRP